jgi:mgtE-like transporter
MIIQIRELRTKPLSGPLSRAFSFFHDFSDLFRQAPFSLLFCSFTGLVAGIVLSLMTGMLQTLPGLMILIPPAIAMRGNIYSALVSRLGTSMHLGLFSPNLERGGILYKNAYTSLVLTLVLSVTLGFLAKGAAQMFGTPNIEYLSLHGFVLISVVAGLISGFILLLIALLISLGTLLSLFCILAAFVWAVKGLKSKEAVVRRILVESIPMLFICGILDTIAGITLHIQLEHLIALPAILIIIPPFLGESNALGGILSARLSSMLHIGIVEPKSLPEKVVTANFAVIYLLSIVLFLFVGLLAYCASIILGLPTPNVITLLAISFLGGLLITTFLNIASYYIAILSFRFGLDPDNDTIPLITALTDVVGVLCLLFAMHLVL